MAVLGTPLGKSSQAARSRLLEIYVLKRFFGYEDADDLRRGILVQVDGGKPNQPVEERLIVREREVDPLKEPPPVSRRILDERREGRRALKYRPAQWLPWALLLVACSLAFEG
ncbi:MAG: hypothetical protein JXA37_07575 [Chloroflexia bacterium]|nr:hypothetical protein [Chloroflexia bacterium]